MAIESSGALGVMKFGWREEYIMPLEDAVKVMSFFKDARKITKKEDGTQQHTPIGEYPSLSIMPKVIFDQLELMDLIAPD